MDGHKHEGLSDKLLEREIEAALGVDPSPEFLPRVRARIANERMRDGWITPWRWAGAVAVVTMVVVAGVWFLRAPAIAPREARTTTPELRTPNPESRLPSPAPVTPAVVRAVRTTPRPRVVAPFEVVISPDDAVALRQLVVAISARQVEAADIPALGAESAPLPPIEEIALEPIKLSPMAGLEGE